VTEYIVHPTIPPNTLRSSPVVIEVDVDLPLITHKEISFPLNAAMLCGVQLCDHAGQIWPAAASPSSWITGDNFTVQSDSPIALRGSPYTILVKIYNEDCLYERTPEIRFENEAPPAA
jgi:hypothetical protein